MKIGTTEKLKFKNLQRRLRLPLWQTVGLLESLWKVVVCRNTPAGDVGRLSNEDIAGLLEWHGDVDELIDALVATGWLDTDPTHRLLVHDWEQECEGWLKGNLHSNKKDFARRTSAIASNGASGDACSNACVTAPYPPIPYHPLPLPDAAAPTTEGATWAAVSTELFSEGVSMVESVIEACRNRRNSPTNAMMVIQHFRQLSPRPGVGLLVSKLRNMQDGSKVTWPPEYTRRIERVSEGLAKSKQAIDERGKHQREREKNAAIAAKLEVDFGARVDAMQIKEVRALVEDQFKSLVQFIPKKRPISGLLRATLLQHFATQEQPCTT